MNEEFWQQLCTVYWTGETLFYYAVLHTHAKGKGSLLFVNVRKTKILLLILVDVV